MRTRHSNGSTTSATAIQSIVSQSLEGNSFYGIFTIASVSESSISISISIAHTIIARLLIVPVAESRDLLIEVRQRGTAESTRQRSGTQSSHAT